MWRPPVGWAAGLPGPAGLAGDLTPLTTSRLRFAPGAQIGKVAPAHPLGPGWPEAVAVSGAHGT